MNVNTIELFPNKVRSAAKLLASLWRKLIRERPYYIGTALIINDLLKELEKRKIKTYIKGSYGYNAPHANSDLDIQIDIDNVIDLKNLALDFNADVKIVEMKTTQGNPYLSYSISFIYQGIDVDVIYEDDSHSFEKVKSIIENISKLPSKDKYILRLVGGALKYADNDSYKNLLLIFERYKQTLDKKILKKIEKGQLLEHDLAKTIRSIVQILYINEFEPSYRVHFLSNKK